MGMEQVKNLVIDEEEEEEEGFKLMLKGRVEERVFGNAIPI